MAALPAAGNVPCLQPRVPGSDAACRLERLRRGVLQSILIKHAATSPWRRTGMLAASGTVGMLEACA